MFGAGIAGLTAAHELARLGYHVTVYERNSDAGGFFRSARLPQNRDIPSEYSWHGIGPWYHNVFDILRQIPYDKSNSLFDRALSRPIDFGMAADDGKTVFDDTWAVNIKQMFRMTWLDVIRGSWLMFKVWVAGRRSVEYYSRLNAAECWRDYLSERCWRIWRSSFGPWIGSDWTNVSLHTAGKFFRKQLISQPTYYHRADSEGPSWRHGARSGWLLLRGPSSEAWFAKWVTYLQSLGVTFRWQCPLEEIYFNGAKIVGARTTLPDLVQADYYVVAANPFAVANILRRTPELQRTKQLCQFQPLTADGAHTQVSLRFAFTDQIQWPRERTAVVVATSEYNLTLFAQEQAWDEKVSLGHNIRSLWTITACVATVPGRIYQLPLERCSKAQFIEEVKAQLIQCDGLQALIREANNGRELCECDITYIEVWHEWQFSSAGIETDQAKWVNRTTNQQHLPTQKTPIANLVLAGAHTKTDVDVWSIEAAVESGRRAAQVIAPSVEVLTQYRPGWLKLLEKVDDLLFYFHMPNVLDVLLFTLLLILSIGAAWIIASYNYSY